jgi:hypothetical protein
MSAIISACGQYRYTLSRPGDMTSTRGPALFIMLNPSTADGEVDDATIIRCRGFARTWGCDGIQVLNLYALRSVEPEVLWAHPNPVGPENDAWLTRLALSATEVVCAWGVNGQPSRVREVTAMLTNAGVKLKCLGTTQLGAPRHPLYVRKDQPLVDWALPPETATRGRKNAR